MKRKTNADEPVFNLDHQEFGEIWYAMIAKALDICRIGWTDKVKIADKGLADFYYRVFGDNDRDNGPNFGKPEFRIALARRKDRWLDQARAWFNDNPWAFEIDDPVGIEGERIAFVWNRQKPDDYRNSTIESLKQICAICRKHKYTVVLTGSRLGRKNEIGFDHNLTSFYTDLGLNPIQQLLYLRRIIAGRPSVSIGLQTGGMDGLALFCNQPTLFLSRQVDAKNGMMHLAKKLNCFRWLEIKYKGKFEEFSEDVEKKISRLISPTGRWLKNYV